MKNKSLLLLAALYWLSACELNVSPNDAVTTENLALTSDGLRNALNGIYALYKDKAAFKGEVSDNNWYLRQYYQMADFASDDITCGQVTTDDFFKSFTLGHTPTQSNAGYFWFINYKMIASANTVIDAASRKTNPDATTNQLLGECYFLRAFAHLTLLKYFAKPYTVDPQAPGVVLRTSLTDPSEKERSTVAQSYDAVIADAEQAASLMTLNRGKMYATREAAWALLSRAYLYKGDHAKAVEYATKVIDSGRFSLTQGMAYDSLFAKATESTETIFCIAMTPLEDYGKGSVASMLYTDGNSGWGEEFASESIRNLMKATPEDSRWHYIKKGDLDNNGQVDKKNGIETYYITKFSFQSGRPNLSSPIMFRLAEMYLNRAEANAKLNKTADALKDVDAIRKNRNLTGTALYNGVVPGGSTLLDVVLKERRLELAFEGHRTFDVYRNKLKMDRTYWGYHLPGLKETDIDLSQKPANFPNMVINYDNPRIIYYIPIDETLTNAKVQQNK